MYQTHSNWILLLNSQYLNEIEKYLHINMNENVSF